MLKSRIELSSVMAALADPSRRALVERLDLGPASVSDLAAPMGITLAAVLQHVQILEAAGVLVTRKDGRSRICELRPEALSVVERWLAARKKAFWAAGMREIEQSLTEPQPARRNKRS